MSSVQTIWSPVSSKWHFIVTPCGIQARHYVYRGEIIDGNIRLSAPNVALLGSCRGNKWKSTMNVDKRSLTVISFKPHARIRNITYMLIIPLDNKDSCYTDTMLFFVCSNIALVKLNIHKLLPYVCGRDKNYLASYYCDGHSMGNSY